MVIPASVPSGVLKVSSPATKDYWEIPVIYSDEHLLAIDKPAGLLTSPDRYDPDRPNLADLLHAHISKGTPWAKERGLTYLTAAHRLEFDTSGVLLFARSKAVLLKLADQFGANLAVWKILALVSGTPEEDSFEVDAPLSPHPVRPGVMRVDHDHGKHSLTRFRILERFVGSTWLECVPVTSRNHQVRTHLWWVKNSVVGDRVYSGKPLWLSEIKPGYRARKSRPERPLMNRTALHASSLELKHPVTGATLLIESAPARDLQIALKYLRRYALGPGLVQTEPGFPVDGPDEEPLG